MREYKSGTRWCVWRWTEVPSEYIRRLHLIKCPWFAVCLHWLLKPDPEPYLHDHPVSFLSLILRGWYGEYGPDAPHLNRWFRWYRATDRHSIVEVAPGTVTLCFMGPRVREWGYHTPSGWVHWKQYNGRQ
jgi:hypothetical protein